MDVDKSDFISKEELINACLKCVQPCLLLLIERLTALTQLSPVTHTAATHVSHLSLTWLDDCRYDDRSPKEGIEDTFYAVEDEVEPDPRGLSRDHFFLWLVLMFGDCTNDEFESATLEFTNAINAVSPYQARVPLTMLLIGKTILNELVLVQTRVQLDDKR